MQHKSGVRLIDDERDRQVFNKGFGSAHDDAHTDGSIVQAAIDILDDYYTTAKYTEPVGAAPWPLDLARSWRRGAKEV